MFQGWKRYDVVNRKPIERSSNGTKDYTADRKNPDDKDDEGGLSKRVQPVQYNPGGDGSRQNDKGQRIVGEKLDGSVSYALVL